jgi:hypothetical protein
MQLGVRLATHPASRLAVLVGARRSEADSRAASGLPDPLPGNVAAQGTCCDRSDRLPGPGFTGCRSRFARSRFGPLGPLGVGAIMGPVGPIVNPIQQMCRTSHRGGVGPTRTRRGDASSRPFPRPTSVRSSIQTPASGHESGVLVVREGLHRGVGYTVYLRGWSERGARSGDTDYETARRGWVSAYEMGGNPLTKPGWRRRSWQSKRLRMIGKCLRNEVA